MSNDIPAINNAEMDRQKLVHVLEYLGYRVGEHFSHKIRLVVHGGACMLLHPGLHKLAKEQARMTPDMPIRKTTRDVDYIHRAFVNEWMAYGEHDAEQKLHKCIRETAIKFGLGADWMNSAADVALPMAMDPNGRQYDPIYTASIQKSNIELHTIFSSANGMLKLISVAPFWAVALKLVRYAKWDPSDVCLLLKYGTILSRGSLWSREYLEDWLMHHCWTMGYAKYHPNRKLEMRKRIDHAITMVNSWYKETPTLEEFSPTNFRTDGSVRPGSASNPETVTRALPIYASRESVMGTRELDRDQAVWGGGDRSGWEASFAGDWVKPNASPASSQLPPPPVAVHRQKPPAQHHHSYSTTLPLSPLFHSDGGSLTSLDSMMQQNQSSSMADWVAEGERQLKKREKKRESTRERKRNLEKEEEGEVTVPFIPPLDSIDGNDYHGHRKGGGMHESGHWQKDVQSSEPRHHSQPPVSRQSYHPWATYYAPPQRIPPAQHHTTSKAPQPNTRSTLQIYAPTPNSSTIYDRNPPHVWNEQHLNTWMHPLSIKADVKARRREKGKKRDKARDKARSTKWHQAYNTGADSLYTINAWRGDSDSGSDSDEDNETRTATSAPPQQTIYPLTTVVYYNQQYPQDVQASPPKPSPPQPQHGQTHGQTAAPTAHTWPPPMSIPPISTQMPMSMPRFIPPIPASMPVHRPVIPPDEYLQHDRSSSTLQRLMGVLKVS